MLSACFLRINRRAADAAFPALFAVLAFASALHAQIPDAAALRTRLEQGDAQGVLDAVRRGIATKEARTGHLLVAAEAALSLGEFPHARGMADLAVAQSPQDSAAHAMAGHVLYAFAQDTASRARGGGSLVRATFADAASCYAAARRCGGDVYDTAVWEADARHMAGEFDAALDALATAEQARAADLHAARLHARILTDANRTQAAQEFLDAAVAQHETDLELRLLHLRSALHAGNREKAKQSFLAAAQHFPDQPEVFRIFIGAFEAERPDAWLDAVLTEAAALLGDGRDTALLWYRGALHEAAGRLDQAHALFTEYLKRRPEAPEGHYKLGTTLVGLGRLAEARIALLRAHGYGTLDQQALAAALRGLVGAYVNRQQFQYASELQGLLAAMTTEPLDALNHGVLLFQSGRRQDGITAYRGLAAREDLDPVTKSKVLNFLGLALLGAGEEGGEAALRSSLDAFGGNLDARENLAMHLLTTGRTAEALRCVDEVLLQEPGRARALYIRMGCTSSWVPARR